MAPILSAKPSLPPIPASNMPSPRTEGPPSRSSIQQPSSTRQGPSSRTTRLTAGGPAGSSRDVTPTQLRRGEADRGEREEREKEKKRRRDKSRGKGAYETFVFVRPPPSSKTNPMNFQCQLVVAQPPGLGPQRRASDYSVNDTTTSRLSTASSVNGGLALSASSTSLDRDPHRVQQEEILASPGRSRPARQDDDDERDGEGSTNGAGLRPLSRSGSLRSINSTRSTQTTASTSSSVATSFYSTTSTSSTTKRVIPLYNLQFHTVRATIVTDAGTDAKIGAFGKRSLDLSGLGSLECCEMTGPVGGPSQASSSAGPSSTTTSPPLTAGSSYFPPSATNSGGLGSPLMTTTSNGRLGVPEPTSSPRISIDTLFSRPSFDDHGGGRFGLPSTGSKTSRSTTTSNGAGGQGGKKAFGGFEETALAGKKFFGKIFGKRKEDEEDGDGNSTGGGDEGRTGGGMFRNSQSMSSLFSTTSRDSHSTSTTTPSRLLSTNVKVPSTSPPLVFETPAPNNSATASASAAGGSLKGRPRSVFSTHSTNATIGSATVSATGVGGAVASGGGGGGGQAYLGPPTLGLAPVVRPPEGLGGSSRAGAYIWVVSKWASPHDGWSFAAMTETISSTALHTLSPDGRHPQTHTTTTTVHFEWIKGRVKGGASRRGSAGTQGGQGPPTSTSRTPPSPAKSLPALTPVGTRSSLADDELDGEREGEEDGDGDGGEEEEEEDPEDSEVPWLCYVVKTSLDAPSGSLGEAGTPKVERMLLGRLSPAPHHPKIVAQLRMPYPLSNLTLPKGFNAAGLLTPEQLKDVVCTTAMFLFVREEWGGIGRKGKK